MGKMNERIARAAARYFAGEATPEDMAMLTAWLEENTENAREFAGMADIEFAVRPPFDPEGIDTDAALGRTISVMHKEERKSRRVRFIRILEHAAAVLFLPLALLSAYLLSDKMEQDESATAWQTVTTPFRTNTCLELPDGSKVWLNGGSTIRYPLSFGKDGRSVSLTGEAYFEVESDKSHPFIVQTRNVKVTATGTAFNVDAFRNDDIVSVTMVRGVVDIDMKGKTLHMSPGDRVSFNQRVNTYSITRSDPEKWCAWRNGRIIFENDRLDYVFHRLGQLYNVEFTVCDPSVDKYVYHAVFTDETLPEILDMLSISAPIRYEITKSDSPDPAAPKQHIRVYGK